MRKIGVIISFLYLFLATVVAQEKGLDSLPKEINQIDTNIYSPKVNLNDSIEKIAYSLNRIPDSSRLSFRVDLNYLSADTNAYNFYNSDKFYKYDVASTGNININYRPFIDTISEHVPFFNSLVYIPYYTSNKKMFSTISESYGYYSLGGKNQQNFKLKHYQSLGELMGISIDFDKITSTGDMQDNQQDINNVQLNGFVTNDQKNYWSFLRFSRNKTTAQLNGGYSSDTLLFDKDINKELVPVFLNKANYFSRNWEIGFEHHYLFTKDTLKYYNPEMYDGLHVDVSYFDGLLKYSEQPNSGSVLDTNYYKDYFFSINNTYDSKSLIRLGAIGAFQKSLSKDFLNPKYLKLAGVYEQVEYSTTEDYIFFRNYGISPELLLYFNQKFQLDYKSNFVLEGNNKGNFNLKLNNKFIDRYENELGLNIYQAKYAPMYEDVTYSNNNFIWTNNFEDISELRLNAFYYLRKLNIKASVNYIQYGNYVFLDKQGEDIMPVQLGNEISILEANLHHKLKLNTFYFENNFTYTQNSNTDAFSVPEFFLKSSIYYLDKGELFKGKLSLQLGLDVTYFSSYTSYAFVPSLNRFYVSDEFQTGNYPFLDIFAALQIGQGRFFLKATHLNSGWIDVRSFSAENYTFSDRRIEFGLDWRFKH